MKVGWLVLVLVLGVVASSGAEDRVYLEQGQSRSPQHGWFRAKDGYSAFGRKHKLTFALKQQNKDVLAQKVKDISYPSSPSYGKFMSHAEVKDLVAPPLENIQTVSNWIQSETGATPSLTESGDFLTVFLTHAQVQKLLQVQLIPYRHLKHSQTLYRSPTPYSLPSSIAPLVDFVGGVSRFPPPSRRGGVPSAFFPSSPSSPSTFSDYQPEIVGAYPSDKSARFWILPHCANGNITTNPDSLCFDQFGSSEFIITDFLVSVTSSVNGVPYTDALNPREIPVSQWECKQCSEWKSEYPYQACGNIEPQNTDAVFCLSPLITDLPNSVPLTVEIAAVTSPNNKKSAFGKLNNQHFYLGPFMSPSVLQTRYAVPPGTQGNGKGYTDEAHTNTMAVAEFFSQFYSNKDLDMFMEAQGLPPASPLVTVQGPNNETNPGGEASLDIQYIMGVAPNISLTFYSYSNLHDGQEPFLEWIVDVLNKEYPEWVHSVSYGDDEQTLSTDYMYRVDVEFQKAAARGLTLVVSSGDNGVGHAGPSDDDKTACPDSHFVPGFPASSPHITAVGATQFSNIWKKACTTPGPGGSLLYACEEGEIVSSTETGSRITSGAGFSQVFLRPEYQEKYVKEYLSTFDQDVPSSWYSQKGRCYADVSASGRNFPTFIGGSFRAVDGTSAAAPVVASLFALMNEYLNKESGSRIGFANPLLYEMPKSCFFDVVMGNSHCPEDLNACCEYGLSSVVGYDAPSGLGTPRFFEMRTWLNDLLS